VRTRCGPALVQALALARLPIAGHVNVGDHYPNGGWSALLHGRLGLVHRRSRGDCIPVSLESYRQRVPHHLVILHNEDATRSLHRASPSMPGRPGPRAPRARVTCILPPLPPRCLTSVWYMQGISRPRAGRPPGILVFVMLDRRAPAAPPAGLAPPPLTYLAPVSARTAHRAVGGHTRMWYVFGDCTLDTELYVVQR